MEKKLPIGWSVVKTDNTNNTDNTDNTSKTNTSEEQQTQETQVKEFQDNPPHKCKFCGKEMEKIDDETLAQMPPSLIETIGQYHCKCSGYSNYLATVIEEQKLRIYIAKTTEQIRAKREKIFYESAFCKDIAKLQKTKEHTETAIENLKMLSLNKEAKKEHGAQATENYFTTANQFNQERQQLLDYYFWPTF